ncbi:permease [Dermacoccus sp. PAMC28757]|uniref:permease n=1 Tax=Dermacoccus sp. PAMC28757 TaxID=2762331 RepID=UPI00210550A5|nr:permease [Dermacoccus sp. PAMC28757]
MNAILASTQPTGAGRDPLRGPGRTTTVVGVALTLVVLVVGLAWAKWIPYDAKARALAESGTWSGKAIFGKAGQPGDAPSWHGAVEFTRAYVTAVWKAALVAILVASALEAFVPKRLILDAMNRRSSWAQGVSGGLLALPSMMCTCCTAPVAIGLRRRGAPAGATMAYWLANPLLNPAVLLFLGLTMSWQMVSTRVAVGVLVVVGAAFIAQRRARAVDPSELLDVDSDPRSVAQMPVRFLKALARYLVIVIPEYLLLVVLTGLFSGWLSDFAHLGDRAGLLALVIVGVVGALLVIPTGGEIPVIAGLTAAGVGFGTAGVLLITLPALSVPSLVMVARSFGVRTTLGVTAWVITGGLVAAAVLTAIA